MKYAGNLTNAIRGALALTATNVAPSNAIYRTAITRTGGGLVTLVGPYTAQNDATFEVEVLNDTVTGAPQISAPTFAGVGNGTMTGIDATASVSPQRIDVTLVDLGTETRNAYTPWQGVTLRAAAAGAGGNDITITVDDAGITKTETDYSLLAELRAGVNEYTGLEWDFGAAVLTPEGTIPASAPRITFGADPQVYRAYKQFRDGAYVYGFSPAPVRTVAAGARISTVTGSRTVTVTDGVTTDTYTGVTTLYSLLDAIQQDTGALVEVVEPVTVDNRPGGMGVTEMSILTQSFVATFNADGSQYAKDADIGLVITADAPTEKLSIRCIDATTVGSEIWAVAGSVSGQLDDAITGAAYDGEDYDFRIPHVESVSTTTTGLLNYSVQYAPRADAVPDACIQLYRPQLGRNARDKEISFVYTLRPAPACDCDAEAVSGGPNPDCLGQPPEGEDELATQPLQQQRLERITSWLATITAKGTFPFDGYPGLSATAREVASLLSDGLRRLFGGTVEYSSWAVATPYALGVIRRPTTPNGLRYRVSTAGTSHASTQPTWPTTTGATVADNTVTWTCIGKEPLGLYDEVIDLVEADFNWLNALGGLRIDTGSPGTWAAAASKLRGNVVVPTTRNGRMYVCTQPNDANGTTGGTEPTWPTSDYGTVTDGGVTWMALPRYWQATTSFTKGRVGYFAPTTRVNTQVVPVQHAGWRVKTAGTTGASEPNWELTDLGELTDGSVVWEWTQLSTTYADGASALDVTDAYRDRINSQITQALGAAGVDPTFEDAGIQGNECWQDPGDSHWWVPSDPAYLPAFSNTYYHSSKRGFDVDGDEIAISTQEFGFAIQCCDQIEGDTVVITIEGAGGGRVYQQGDVFVADIIRAAPAQLGGGQTGDDTLTWRVTGSVDSGFELYLLDRVTPNAYNDVGNGLEFLITPGGIDFELGDTFTFYAEGGEFRWRKDAGSWTTTAIAPSVSLSDGVSATFTPGSAPSFVDGDTYTFTAEAIYGPARLVGLNDGPFKCTASTVIVVTPDSAASADGIFLGDHTIPNGTTITLEGSNDDFATSPLNVTFQTAARDSWHEFTQAGPYGKFRVTIPAACEVEWLWIGLATEAALQGTGARELGRLRKRQRLPSIGRRAGLGVGVEHAALSQESVDELLGLFMHATESDASRIGIACNGNAEPTQASLVEVDGETVTVEDVLDYQPTDTDRRHLALTLTLNAIP